MRSQSYEDTSNDSQGKKSAAQKKRGAKKEPQMTSGERRALESAQGYLEMSGSRRWASCSNCPPPPAKASLIEQLSSSAGENFTLKQARYAVSKVY